MSAAVPFTLIPQRAEPTVDVEGSTPVSRSRHLAMACGVACGEPSDPRALSPVPVEHERPPAPRNPPPLTFGAIPAEHLELRVPQRVEVRMPTSTRVTSSGSGNHAPLGSETGH